MKKLVLLVVVSALLSACNTFQGLGKDIEKGGEIIQENAK